MGLDMYAYRTKVQLSKPVDFADELNAAHEAEGESQMQELAYWRKHPNLHGWMEELYRRKGGTAEDFNCVPVELTLDDLFILEADIKYGKLPDTNGFFFGQSDGSEEEKHADLEFVQNARRAIEEGDRVFYDSWW
jgi:hypothetical protein